MPRNPTDQKMFMVDPFYFTIFQKVTVYVLKKQTRYTTFYMGTLVKIFAVFWAVWIIWYLTGGPLRDDKTKPYVGFTESGEIQPMGTSTLKQ